MAKRMDGINKSHEIRELLKANPTIKAREIVSTLGLRGIKVSGNLVYLIKGKTHAKRARKEKQIQRAAKVALTTGPADALATIIKIKHLAHELGGMKRLKALVEALSE